MTQPKDNPAWRPEPDCTAGLLKADMAAVVTCVMVLIKDAVVPAVDAGALFEIKWSNAAASVVPKSPPLLLLLEPPSPLLSADVVADVRSTISRDSPPTRPAIRNDIACAQINTDVSIEVILARLLYLQVLFIIPDLLPVEQIKYPVAIESRRLVGPTASI